ncbi:MAG: glycosyltransferase [Clostridia bacterium]|nr:glycosyltransferase [Clostridia bacterium]
MRTETTCVLLVTYNRSHLLLPLLDQLKKQTKPVNGILIVDNAATDGTPEKLKDHGVIQDWQEDRLVQSDWGGVNVYYFRSPVNTGGSGGFAKAFELVQQLDYDLVWAMDDDVFPADDCLEQLAGRLTPDVQVCVPSRDDGNWEDTAITAYNLTNPFLFALAQIKTLVWTRDLTTDTVEVADMVFEGPLMTMDVLKKTGVPNKDYFIKYDDTDYAHRLREHTRILYVKNAILHKKIIPSQDDMSAWNWSHYYLLRNQFVFDRTYGKNLAVKYFRPVWSVLVRSAVAVIRKRPYRIKLLVMAYKDALLGHMGKTLAPGTDITKL